ncbi:hypothetical protein F2P81_023570 [Scophthalmus maximus]|uniref:Uncharacterized protein n=1 Tax=Scophthalmus maximus TaxID=52904 RepID=A0A6A4RXV8_SCOMX|nr:hypothetical protein F2P81_023570 [Scophthalmus maximus]
MCEREVQPVVVKQDVSKSKSAKALEQNVFISYFGTKSQLKYNLPLERARLRAATVSASASSFPPNVLAKAFQSKQLCPMHIAQSLTLAAHSLTTGGSVHGGIWKRLTRSQLQRCYFGAQERSELILKNYGYCNPAAHTSLVTAEKDASTSPAMDGSGYHGNGPLNKGCVDYYGVTHTQRQAFLLSYTTVSLT